MAKSVLLDRIESDFTYHPPSPKKRRVHQEIDRVTRVVAQWIVQLCPEGRDLSIALTSLEDVRMRCNKAIALGSELDIPDLRDDEEIA